MYAVVETPTYLASAKEEGMTEAEMKAAVDLISASSLIGDLIAGSGGCRKVRLAGIGKGKSGGYRVVSYYCGEGAPVFLIAVLAKNSRANFSKAELGAMSTVAKSISEAVARRSKRR